MSMAIDDHDSADLKIDFSARNHVFDPAFNLDSVSYITHETSTSMLLEESIKWCQNIFLHVLL